MSDGRRFLQTGELLMAGEVTLQPGGTYSTPKLFCTYSAEGLNGMSQRFHSVPQPSGLDAAHRRL